MDQFTQGLEVYLVGGAVRDRLLGLKVKERDWVVVGSTPDNMVQRGFRPVGKDFPVFLHPKTQEEYALARTERKTAAGYKGFSVHAAPDVTLEDDLKRRDLTINAIAETQNGDLIDPYGGQLDIQQRHFRHVSNAFAEDPVRILRLARFASQFADFNFSINPSTQELMHAMVTAGEVDALVPERVWKEMEKALLGQKPSHFIRTLRACGALQRLLPEVDQLFGVPQVADYHPEVDSGEHTLLALDRARELSQDSAVIFATLLHDLGKGVTPEKYLPKHHGHEAAGVPLVERLCQRLRVPKNHQALARLVCEQHLNMHRLAELRPSTVLKLLNQLDAFRRPERIEQFALACQADSQGRGGNFYPCRPYAARKRLHCYFDAANNVNAGEIAQQTSNPKNIPKRIEKARENAIADNKNQT